MSRFSLGFCHHVERSVDTPLTIHLQGDWFSGGVSDKCIEVAAFCHQAWRGRVWHVFISPQAGVPESHSKIGHGPQGTGARGHGGTGHGARTTGHGPQDTERWAQGTGPQDTERGAQATGHGAQETQYLDGMSKNSARLRGEKKTASYDNLLFLL